MKSLRGKVAVVTGAASGVGAAVAQRLDQEGMALALADVEREKLHDVAATLSTSPTCCAVDVADPAAVVDFASTVFDVHKNVHLLVNNAGVMGPMGPSWTMEDSDWEWVLGVNVRGIANGVRAFVPRLLEQHEPAHIVNTASEAAFAARGFVSVYHASKHAVLALTEALAQELAFIQAPVRVSVLCPGAINTALMSAERNRPRDLGRGAELHETGAKLADLYQRSLERGIDPADVADTLVDGVLNERFYLLPHPEVIDLPSERAVAVKEDIYPALSEELAELIRNWRLNKE